MLSSENNFVFLFISFIVFLITIFLTYYTYTQFKIKKNILAEICILAGSCSNLIDRYIYGGVIDFILFEYKNYAFPIFNLADIAIVSGVFLMVLSIYTEKIFLNIDNIKT